ncbi:transcription factor-like 5 protein [Chaetodon trifascialis]|uniref:transcription factor-like 5 protein n=1 Tax=Chaetodon trifascialis TaxID=109706 RepID=UPI0039952F91
MSSFSSACKTIHVSPSASFREHTGESAGVILSQGGCLTHDQGNMIKTELGLMEISEVEYTQLQHLIQAHMEAQAATPDGPDARSHPATVATGSTVISPFTTTQAIDLSTSADEHCVVMPGEKTPASYGEVPGFVLARVRGEESPNESLTNSSTSSQKRSRSTARVCLEKRFNTVSADIPRQQDIHSAVFNNFFTLLQSAEAHEAVLHPQKWVTTDRANPFEVSSPFVGGVLNTVTNMCEQVIGHIPNMIEPKHQGPIIPRSFSFNFLPERVVTKVHYASSRNSAEEQQLANIENCVVTPAAASRKSGSTNRSQSIKTAKAALGSFGKSGSRIGKRAQPLLSPSQRRERHNSKERERRKKIRSCCDELNMLVPFCDSDSDKVTTLQWTTAFLRYINKTYGDSLKEEFKQAFTDEKGLLPKTKPSSGQEQIHWEMDESLVVEQ